MEFLLAPWPWYVSGPIVGATMALLLLFGKSLGLSSNFRIVCSACGAGKKNDFFNFNWKNESWNLVFAIGCILGGYISMEYLGGDHLAGISKATQEHLAQLGITSDSHYVLPTELFSKDAIFSFKGISMLSIGGFLIGFGSRYAGGCTSGHAISGLSNLQLPSLIAVIGYFIGGLIMTWLILPFIL
ncbi:MULTISPECIES: YeeE/YedE family protein [Flammeovirga]|uniref:YeeE/YedE family protein n=1 Tax=Flammeovirga agarivorans TaxID=2726742 RepID=A0A7X8SNZ7_9BACT|nr:MULTISPECIES: YeeE/YedE thiosulfate transporter family protein [Flammeovirga]NLR93653.1 YeeE/YedE family protein [Flammeovirga agarivorans]